MAKKPELDGELFLGTNTPPDLSSFEGFDDEMPGVFDLVQINTAASAKNRPVIFERALFKYKDPTSPPHTRTKCSKWMKPGLGAKICIGWTVNKRWLYRVGALRVTTVSEDEARKAVEECLKQGAIAAAIAGAVSGGTAAVAAAKITIQACLATKLGDKLIDVTIDVKSVRGGWE